MVSDQLRFGNLSHYANQALLNQLIARNRPVEYLPLEGKLFGRLIAGNSSTNRSAGHTISGQIKTLKNRFESFGIWQNMALINRAILKLDKRCGRCSIGKFTLNRRCTESGRIGIHQKSMDLITPLCPDKRHLGDRTVGYPHFFTIQNKAPLFLLRPCLHVTGIRAESRLGQPETANNISAGHFRQPFLALFLGAEFVNGKHHKRVLNRKHGSQTAVTTA